MKFEIDDMFANGGESNYLMCLSVVNDLCLEVAAAMDQEFRLGEKTKKRTAGDADFTPPSEKNEKRCS